VSVSLHLGVMISLYWSFSTRVVAAMLYGITILLMSKACCSLRLRRCNGALKEWPQLLPSDGTGEGMGDSVRELPLETRSRGRPLLRHALSLEDPERRTYRRLALPSYFFRSSIMTFNLVIFASLYQPNNCHTCGGNHRLRAFGTFVFGGVVQQFV
jgi:hypothetical protein